MAVPVLAGWCMPVAQSSFRLLCPEGLQPTHHNPTPMSMRHTHTNGTSGMYQ